MNAKPILFAAALLCGAVLLQGPARGQEADAKPEAPAKEEKPELPRIGDTKWRIADYTRHGEVRVEEGVIYMERGHDMTGIVHDPPFPRMNYEISLEAMKVDGNDFFCGLTFPVGEEKSCSFICGGWGGTITGLSSLDYMDASENETSDFMSFDKGRWYKIRVRVTEGRIQCWVDEQQKVDLKTEGHKIDIRLEMISCTPLGIANWQTSSAIRKFAIRKLTEAEQALQ